LKAGERAGCKVHLQSSAHHHNDSILDRGGAFTDETFTGDAINRNHISCLEEVEVFAVVVVGFSHRLNTVPPM